VTQGKNTVLVAEGLNDSRLMMKWALEQYGYRVLEAATGEEAVEVARREHPDLILMDLHLPSLDGLEATRRVREIETLRDVPIIATSTLESAELQADAFAAGCTAFRRQPIDFDKFGDVADLVLHHLKRTTESERGGEEGRQEAEVDKAQTRSTIEMTNEENKNKCARETCGCQAGEDSKYCGEECEDAAKVQMMEIGCTCHHPECS
jgi:two-component system cell cycle response regulator DivK